MSLQAQTINITLPSGLTLSALNWHAEAKKPMLALHGWLDNANSFAPLVPFLKAYNIVALDLPGHGQSDHLPKAANYHYIDSIKIAMQFVLEMGWSRFSLLGHSLGGATASLLAGTFPECIEQCFLFDALGPLNREAEVAPQQLRRSIDASLSSHKRQIHYYKTLQEATQSRVNGSELSFDAAALLAERGVKQNDQGFYWCHDRRLLEPSALFVSEAYTITFLEKMVCPVHLFTTDMFRFIDFSLFEMRVKAVKKLHRYEVSGHHHMHMEQPQQFADIINKA